MRCTLRNKLQCENYIKPTSYPLWPLWVSERPSGPAIHNNMKSLIQDFVKEQKNVLNKATTPSGVAD